ncbi:MAG: hypothetical protein JW765_07050 [Deltaproteobacteria bacterium]|nr:hypothetical protein [Candidatus Zymogenaceae bacterium]
MQMKRYVGIVITVFCLCSFAVGAAAAPLTPQDKEQLKWLFGMLETSVNQGDAQGIVNLFSPNMPQERRNALTNSIYATIAGKGIRLSFFPNLSDESIKEIQPGVLYEVTGNFKAEGPQWNVSGLSATFTVERVGYYFYIYDTNLLDKMGPGAVFKTLGVVFLIIGVVFLLGIIGVIIIVILIVRSQKKKKAVVGSGDGPGTV